MQTTDAITEAIMGFEGRFAWHELRAGDVDAAADFYAGLLGWTHEPTPVGRTLLLDGVPIGGVSVVKPGLPGHWTPFVACADVDRAAAAARTGGGIVTTGEPADVPGMGRLAPILDPHKTIFAAITPGPAVPEPAVRVGGFGWERLRTPDPSASAAFYGAAFGWSALLSDDASGGVFELADGSSRVAELVRTAPGDPGGWLSFVRVGDVDGVRARATALGGASADPVTIPGVARFAVITDPEGATLAVTEPA